MVHGHPHNHVIWRKVAPALAEHYTVILRICADTAVAVNP